MFYKLFFLSVFLFFSSCRFVSDDNSKNIARYGESFLTKEEFLSLTEGVKINESISMINSIINNWAIEKILIERAELNLNEAKIQKIQSLADDYKSSLLSEAYLEALVNSAINLEVDSLEIINLFENNKSLFNLNQDIFKLVYIELPLDFSDTYEVRSKIKRFKRDDQIFLDSISFRFKSFSLTTDDWISQNILMQKFPFLTNYSYRSLKNYNFFQFKDSLSLYLIKINESVKKGDISPIDYVMPTLEYMSLNSRKKELMLSIKTDILKDALEKNKLEIY
tara:strand:+ start:699 stop:1538 length:840 start_codon:yes stop_codon:yes gene_type:complete